MQGGCIGLTPSSTTGLTPFSAIIAHPSPIPQVQLRDVVLTCSKHSLHPSGAEWAKLSILMCEAAVGNKTVVKPSWEELSPVWQSGSALQHEQVCFQRFVCHCFPLSWTYRWGKPFVGSSHQLVIVWEKAGCRKSCHLIFVWGKAHGTTCGEPSCLCQGDEHLLRVKHLLFVINIAAITVHFLFHCCLLPVNCYSNP